MLNPSGPDPRKACTSEHHSSSSAWVFSQPAMSFHRDFYAYERYWFGWQVRSGFSLTSYGKTRMNLLTSPIAIPHGLPVCAMKFGAPKFCSRISGFDQALGEWKVRRKYLHVAFLESFLVAGMPLLSVVCVQCRVRGIEKARFGKRMRPALYRSRSSLIRRAGASSQISELLH